MEFYLSVKAAGDTSIALLIGDHQFNRIYAGQTYLSAAQWPVSGTYFAWPPLEISEFSDTTSTASQ